MTEVQVQSREIPVLETVEDIERRREQVLRRYAEFKEATRLKRLRLEEAKRYHQWKRDVDECEIWINEKLQIASDESFKDATNLQVLFCKIYEIFIAEKLVKKKHFSIELCDFDNARDSDQMSIDQEVFYKYFMKSSLSA
jgi:spectrin alpha